MGGGHFIQFPPGGGNIPPQEQKIQDVQGRAQQERGDPPEGLEQAAKRKSVSAHVRDPQDQCQIGCGGQVDIGDQSDEPESLPDLIASGVSQVAEDQQGTQRDDDPLGSRRRQRSYAPEPLAERGDNRGAQDGDEGGD